MSVYSVITGTGSCIPTLIKKNSDFLDSTFLNEDGTSFSNDNETIVQKFKEITGIEERRYAESGVNASDLGAAAAEKAIVKAGIDKNTIDQIIVAHNFGDVAEGSIQGDTLPSVASKIKNKLGIQNTSCIAYDLLFGCPGWVQGVIQAEAFIKSGMAKRVLVIGTETLSRVVDDYDRDSMIYADGAGAVIIEAVESDEPIGVLSHGAQTFTEEETNYLFFGESYKDDVKNTTRYIKMYGRKIYEFALNNVPNAMKQVLDNSGVSIDQVKKICIHQANEKMDEAIVKRFFRLYKAKVPKGVMPMSIHKLGNSSVATVPTLLDLILEGEMEGQEINKGDVIILASVGAGMNINAVVHKF
ncbi:3-oxoacyl-ACP synthase III family protein [Flavicella marina]|uniref:3-oxoacyl-ACP synthase III family protein n=1 Tax=Flavicella marina TaxID=1475951 RepID=UPI001264913D|nr:ketoacyl-ACP synthase III [Flavicella marina]